MLVEVWCVAKNAVDVPEILQKGQKLAKVTKMKAVPQERFFVIWCQFAIESN